MGQYLKLIVIFAMIITSHLSFGADDSLTVYTYKDREHTNKEMAIDVAKLYGVTWVVYPLTQPENFTKDGSLKRYRDNLGDFVFDNDEPIWNWGIHPVVGSQVFLYYRARGYSKLAATGMTFISSTLFEISVETYQEPASIQDLYQTPIYGALLGLALENLSLYLLHSGSTFGRLVGHIINPCTNFDFFETKITVSPMVNSTNSGGVLLNGEF